MVGDFLFCSVLLCSLFGYYSPFLFINNNFLKSKLVSCRSSFVLWDYLCLFVWWWPEAAGEGWDKDCEQSCSRPWANRNLQGGDDSWWTEFSLQTLTCRKWGSVLIIKWIGWILLSAAQRSSSKGASVNVVMLISFSPQDHMEPEIIKHLLLS